MQSDAGRNGVVRCNVACVGGVVYWLVLAVGDVQTVWYTGWY